MKFTEGAFKDWGYAWPNRIPERHRYEREAWILGNRERIPLECEEMPGV